jgi:hypothetical protein
MMAIVVHPRKLETALIKHGLIPESRCRLLEVRLAVGELPVIRYELLIPPADMKALAAAFAEAAEESPE